MTAAQKRGRKLAGRAGAQALARYRAEQAAKKAAEQEREKKRIVFTIEVSYPVADVASIDEVLTAGNSYGSAQIIDCAVRA